MKGNIQFITKLNNAMMDDFIAVNKEKNPIARNRSRNIESLQYVIAQYSIFPKHIVAFLTLAQNRANQMGWKDVEEELKRNIGEELGSKTKGVTHYDMLIKGIKEELGLDISNADLSKSTKNFVETIRNILSNKNSFYIMGATYALEDSAVPELSLVVEWVNNMFLEKTGKPMPEGTLKTFFDGHLNEWEPGHEEGLRRAVFEKILTDEDKDNFEEGFRRVLYTMDIWWNGLYVESKKIKSKNMEDK